MDGFIDVVTDVGPGAVVKGIISGTLRMAIPAMLADKVGCDYFCTYLNLEPKKRISYRCERLNWTLVKLAKGCIN